MRKLLEWASMAPQSARAAGSAPRPRVRASKVPVTPWVLVFALAPSTSPWAGVSAPLSAGDSTQNYEVDQHDLVLAQQGGKYQTGQAATWGEERLERSAGWRALRIRVG